MRIGYLATLMRAGETIFGNFVGGSAELEAALQGTLKVDMAFIIPLTDRAARNAQVPIINQKLTERFGIVVALKNDTTNKDKLGLIAYDQLHNVRSELFTVFLGKHIPEAESVIYYVGGTLKSINAGYLWYQFEFEYEGRLDNDGLVTYDIDDSEIPVVLKTIYANIIQAPSADLPHTTGLPLSDNYPDVVIPDIAQIVDFTDDPRYGGFSSGFSSGFNIYDEDRRY